MLLTGKTTLQLSKRAGKSDPFSGREHDGKSLAKMLIERGIDCASVLIRREPLSPQAAAKSDCNIIRHNLMRSRFEDLVRESSQKEKAEIKACIKERSYPEYANNVDVKRAESHMKYRDQLEKRIQRAFDLMKVPRLFWEISAKIRTELAQEGLTDEELSSRVKAEMFSMMLPQVHTTNQRVMPFSAPFDLWAGAEKWQQWYLFDRGDRIDFVIGGSCDEAAIKQKLYGQAFAIMAKKGYQIPTATYSVSQENEPTFLKEYECFKLGKNESSTQDDDRLYRGVYLEVSQTNFSEWGWGNGQSR